MTRIHARIQQKDGPLIRVQSRPMVKSGSGKGVTILSVKVAFGGAVLDICILQESGTLSF